MVFLLSYQNVFDYLVEHNIFNSSTKKISNIEKIAAKNFNLLVSFDDSTRILVKQEMRDGKGKVEGDFF
ncbi:MAG: hypothetical protein AAF915_04520 [Cyanobacteria bacterium P01_D01_bin.50]